MSGDLNTARALLRAENFEGARRIVGKALEDSPNNLRAWNLRIEIEMDAGEFKEALALTRQLLADHPDDVLLREAEFYAVARMRKKREAKRIFEQFRKDFPFQEGKIKPMNMVLDSLSERMKQVSDTLREYAEYATDPQSVKQLGIMHHKVNDLWIAQRMMLEAHPHFANDAELNAALATNYFQLARPGTARKYARLALASDPTNRRMALLIKATWLQYWPPFFLMTGIFLIYFATSTLFGKIMANVAIVAIIITTGTERIIWYDALNVITGVSVTSVHILIALSWIALYVLCMSSEFYSKFFGKKKSVKLKKF